MKTHTTIVCLSTLLLAAGACTSEQEIPDEGPIGATQLAATQSPVPPRPAHCDDPTTATIVGTAGDDFILGTPGNDIIFGLGGDDIILGAGGDDILCGGDGQDNLKGGDGDDFLFGGADYNWLTGDAGDDSVYGGDDGNELQGNLGADTLQGGNGPDTMYGGDDDDILAGGAGDDDMFGNAGDDQLFGEAGDDWMLGGDGDDCLSGGDDDDQLLGEDGDDNVSGGDGIDGLACGLGADTYSDGEWDFSGCETVGMCDCSPQPPPVPANCTGFSYGGHDYAVCQGQLTRSQAQAQCNADLGWSLAHIDDQAENTAVVDAALAAYGCVHYESTSYWIDNLGSPGQQWGSGATVWAPGEPNGGGGTVHILRYCHVPYGWNDAGGESWTWGWVCESP